jgi:serralysin
MATPTTNFVNWTTIDTSLLGSGKYVADGERWGFGLGVGVTLDYSLPTFNSFWNQPYGSSNEPFNGFIATTALEQSAIRLALSTWARFANVNFVETSDTQFNVGEIRFAKSTSLTNNESAHGYFPSGGPQAGDIWFNPTNQFNHDGGGVPLGSFDYETILHEIGHALGLKHTFDDANNGPANHIPAALDNYFYSIMSYTASPFSPHQDGYATFYPTTPMYYDLLAIEAIYGQRAYATGNTVYTFNDGVRYFQAINDTGGADMMVYNGAENAVINLNPGYFSAVSERIFFHGGSSKATVTIGPNVLIENARGGNGSDLLTGNGAANFLDGRLGNDVLYGVSGNDYLSGGAGNDRLVGALGNDIMVGGPGNDIFLFNTAPNNSLNHDTVTDYYAPQDQFQLENAIFTRLGSAGHLLNPAFFRAYSRPLDANDYLVYNRANGGLFYDVDGSGGIGSVLIAVLSNKPVLSASEFTIV